MIIGLVAIYCEILRLTMLCRDYGKSPMSYVSVAEVALAIAAKRVKPGIMCAALRIMSSQRMPIRTCNE